LLLYCHGVYQVIGDVVWESGIGTNTLHIIL